MAIEYTATSNLPTRYGDFRMQVFTDENGTEHMALAIGVVSDDNLVRIHSECATGDILGSMRCDCRDQLEQALEKISDAGHGLLIYLRGHEGRGIGLANKIKAYALQDQGLDTVEANVKLGFAPDQRDYSPAIAILQHFGLSQVKLLTNNRHKIKALEEAGIKVSEHVSLWTATNPYNAHYVDTKRKRMGHISPATNQRSDSAEQPVRMKRV
ncbi:MAG: GTP cyclohydrolase II [Alphaproteobacteria bacterium]